MLGKELLGFIEVEVDFFVCVSMLQICALFVFFLV